MVRVGHVLADRLGVASRGCVHPPAKPLGSGVGRCRR